MTAPFEISVICPVLIGRTPQLDLLDRLIAEVMSGHGQTVLIAGEAGIGKSRLTAEASARFRAHQAAADQLEARILTGRCFEPDRVLPYAPLLDVLRADLAGRSPAEIATLFGPDGAALARLLPEIAELLPSSAPQPPIAPEQDQRQLTLALARCFTRLGAHPDDAGQSARLLIIEDLHWSDEASLEVLLALARHVPAQPMLVLLTYRSDEVRPELAAFLAALDRERLGTEIHVPRLSIGDVDAQIRTIFDLQRAVSAEFLGTIYTVTEGNPFFIEETLKSLIAAGDIVLTNDAWDTKSLSELRLPRSVQLAVQRRLDQVSSDAREVLTLAALPAGDSILTCLRELTNHDEAALVRLIKQLINAQLVVEESADVFAFRHALTRTAVEADLLARERRALHRVIAEALERRYAATSDKHLADLAEHFFAGEVWASALEYAQRAGEQAQALYAPRAARTQFDRAIEAAQRLGQPPSFELYRARGHAHHVLGDFEAALDDYTQALAAARAAADQAAEWQSLLALGFLWSERDFTQTGAYFQRALVVAHAIGDQATIGHSLNRLGNWHMMVEQPIEARQQHEAALHIFERIERSTRSGRDARSARNHQHERGRSAARRGLLRASDRPLSCAERPAGRRLGPDHAGAVQRSISGEHLYGRCDGSDNDLTRPCRRSPRNRTCGRLALGRSIGIGSAGPGAEHGGRIWARAGSHANEPPDRHRDRPPAVADLRAPDAGCAAP